MTLSIEASMASSGKNAALLSSCHIQISLPVAAFCGAGSAGRHRGRADSAVDGRAMFLICSLDVLSTVHEPSILTCPQAPAGHGALRAGGCAFPFPELAVAIERERRRGRGAQSNASGRFEAEARVAFDDGWQSLDELPPFKTTVALDTARKVITRNDSARYRLRPFDQSLPGLRAWLRLLLRAADPCLSRPVAGARFRIEAVRQAGRAAASGKGTGGARITSRA